VVSFMHWSLHPWGKSPQYPLARRLGRPQSQSRCGGAERRSHHCFSWDVNPSHPVHRQISILIELHWFLLHTVTQQNCSVCISLIFLQSPHKFTAEIDMCHTFAWILTLMGNCSFFPSFHILFTFENKMPKIYILKNKWGDEAIQKDA